MVYSRTVGNKELSFGVSGRLYKSNVLLYDHQTESLWSQLMARAVSGPMAGDRLTVLSSHRTQWGSWMSRYPETRILSPRTGFDRNYALDPYEGYYRVGAIWFPVGDVRKDLPPKERVLGIVVGSASRAYPLSRVRPRYGAIDDVVGGVALRLLIDADGSISGVVDDRGEPLPHLFVYWFAWQAFHPDTTVFEFR